MGSVWGPWAPARFASLVPMNGPPMSSLNLRLPLGPLALAVALTTGAAAAQTPLSGALSDGTTGPLLSGVVYHTTSTISVPSGATLTVQPGAIVKFGFDHRLQVDGTLLCNGTGFDSIVFTDVRDDTAGGDTNGDGASTAPGAGWWRGVQLNAGASGSVLSGVTARFGGRFISNFDLTNCDASFVQCRSELCSTNGWSINTGSRPTLTDCDSRGNAGEAYINLALAALPAMSGLTASNNAFDRMRLGNATVPAGTSLTIGPDNLLAGQGALLGAVLQVPAGAELNLGAGTVLKFLFDGSAVINGTLNCQGTAADPVVFTEERDDTAGGDSNGDGAGTLPAAGWWRGLDLGAGSDASVIEHADVRYGGRFISAFELTSTNPVLRDCLVRDFANHGLDLNTSALPTLDGVTVRDCSGEAINGVRIQALAGFSGLDFDGNSFDRIRISQAVVLAGETVVVEASQLEANTMFLSTSVTVQSGASLTIRPGVIAKMAFDTRWNAQGTLVLDGLPNQRVIITEERDDVGGDTNGDGNSTAPAAGWWRGIEYQTSATGCSARFATVRFGGRFVSGFEITGTSVSIERSSVTDFANAGVDLNQNTQPCPMVLLRVDRCTGTAIQGVRLERLQDIEFARGEGNGRNTVQVTNGLLAGDVTIEPENQFNGSIYCSTSITVPAGVEFNLQSGVVMKMAFDTRVLVDGALTVRASLDKPAIFTEERDDSVGGDTNGDGSSTSPGRGWWRGVHFRSGSNSLLQGLEVRYGGRFQPNILCESGSTAMRDVRVAHSSTGGIRLSAHLIPLEGVVSFDNAQDGVELSGGTFDLRRVTSVGNGGFGIDATAAYGGDVKDSILRSNTQGAVQGLPQGRVRYSNGAYAGVDGNIDLDPLFVDQPGGDLHLASNASPSFNTGDPASPLDPDSTRADMGAYFFNTCTPSVVCQQPQVYGPCAQEVALDGFASLSSPAPFVISLVGTPTQTFGLFFYGIGAPATVPNPFGTICVGAPYVRSTAILAGGNFADGPCAGRFDFDFNAYLQAGLAPNVVAGSNVIGHLWYRNPASPVFASFSAGIQIPVCP